MAGTKGLKTRQRIVEMAAPVFNRQGFAGASMRDLISATGLEKGGIYNHFGSKEQLALEAYDFAMSRTTNVLARSQDGATDAVDRLTRMIRAFGTFSRKPAIAGGCPIMNSAIEADRGNPDLRDRAKESMTLWHRLIGRIVKDGIAVGSLASDTEPYALAALLTSSLEGALMLSRLYDDPAYTDRVVDHLVAYVETLRSTPPVSGPRDSGPKESA